MEDISSVTALKGNSFQLLLNRGGHPVIHFRSRSLEELKNWMAMLKVGLAKGKSTCCVCACVRASVHACMHAWISDVCGYHNVLCVRTVS